MSRLQLFRGKCKVKGKLKVKSKILKFEIISKN